MTIGTKPVIGIACCSVEVNNRNTAFIGIFESYIEAVLKCGGDAILLPVSNDTAAIDICHGLILVGGEDLSRSNFWSGSDHGTKTDSRRDDFETVLVKRCESKKIPLLGLCRGAQLINCVLGGLLAKTMDVGSCDHGGKFESRHSVRLKQGSLISKTYLGALEIDVLSRHSAIISKMGRKLTPVAWATDNTVEAFEAEDWPCVGIIWHVEWNGVNMIPDLAPFRWLVERAGSGMR